MKKSIKIWLAVTGILLLVLGVICICNPAETLFASAWMIGALTLASGIFGLAFTLETQAFIPNSGTRMLSALLDIFFGCFFLFNLLGTALSLPFVFAIWVIIEGISVFVASFDYKKVGFPYWWALMLLGIAGIVLGICGIMNMEVTAVTLSVLISIPVILFGLANILAVAGVNRFEKEVKNVVNHAFKG
jgi:uncharacterized membrane protein HdeD (DUF308 family)